MLPELLRFGVIEQCGVGSGFVGTAAGVVGGVEKGQQLSCRRSHDYRVVAPLSVVDVALEFAVLDGAAKLCEARMPDMQGSAATALFEQPPAIDRFAVQLGLADADEECMPDMPGGPGEKSGSVHRSVRFGATGKGPE